MSDGKQAEKDTATKSGREMPSQSIGRDERPTESGRTGWANCGPLVARPEKLPWAGDWPSATTMTVEAQRLSSEQVYSCATCRTHGAPVAPGGWPPRVPTPSVCPHFAIRLPAAHHAAHPPRLSSLAGAGALRILACVCAHVRLCLCPPCMCTQCQRMSSSSPSPSKAAMAVPSSSPPRPTSC